MARKWSFSVAVKVSTVLLLGVGLLLLTVGLILKQVPSQQGDNEGKIINPTPNSGEDPYVKEYFKQLDNSKQPSPFPFKPSENVQESEDSEIPLIEEENEEDVPI